MNFLACGWKVITAEVRIKEVSVRVETVNSLCTQVYRIFQRDTAQSVVQGLAAVASAFDSLLGMQNLGPFPRPTELKSAFEPDPQCTLKVKH